MPATPLGHRARRARPVGSTGLGSDFRPTLLVTAAVYIARPRSIPLGRLMLVADSPTGRLRSSPASLWSPPCPATTGNRHHRNDAPVPLRVPRARAKPITSAVPPASPPTTAAAPRTAPLDSITRGYVEEALNTYRACCYKATAVLIGAAVERLVFSLRDELAPRLKKRGTKPIKGLDAWQAKTALEAVAQQLRPDLASD